MTRASPFSSLVPSQLATYGFSDPKRAMRNPKLFVLNPSNPVKFRFCTLANYFAELQKMW
jgi:hypothetical protein